MKILNKKVKIKYIYLKFVAYLYSVLPLIIFFVGWLKWYLYLLALITVSVCLFLSFCKKTKEECDEHIEVNVYIILLVALISFLYAYFCGIGRLWAQSKDYPWRNAIFRDLILKEWPVLYDKYNGALVYYIGLWLPSAFVTKLFLGFGISDSTAFIVGNILFLLYVSFGLSILFFMISFYFKISKNHKILLSIILFIFFSGMDILGSIEPLAINGYHLEWWAEKYQYSSFTTCMCWVFNQALIPWIITLIIIKDQKIEDFVFLGMMCLMSGPLPFLGVFIYCILFGFKELINCIKIKKFYLLLKRVFSLSNILSTLFIFPFLFLYYISNYAFKGTGISITSVADSALMDGGNISSGDSFLRSIWIYIAFCLVEFLFLALMIFRKYKKEYLFYITIIMLFLFPFGQVGYGYDFPMRASIPALFVLYLLATKFVFEERQSSLVKQEELDLIKKRSKIDYYVAEIKKCSYVFLLVCLIIGSITPIVEFYRGFQQVIKRGINDPFTDYIVTLDGSGGIITHYDYTGYEFGNFVSINKDDELFFKYICK